MARLLLTSESKEAAVGLIDLLLVVLIAGICGAIAQAMVGFSRGGCLASIGFGFIGALVGFGLARFASLPPLLSVDLGTVSFPIVWTLLGAVICVAAVALVQRGRLDLRS